MGFFLPLIIVLAIQWVLQYLLIGVFNFPIIWVNIIIDAVLSVVFSLFRFRGRETWTNPEFHKSIAIYFAIFTVMTVLMYYL